MIGGRIWNPRYGNLDELSRRVKLSRREGEAQRVKTMVWTAERRMLVEDDV